MMAKRQRKRKLKRKTPLVVLLLLLAVLLGGGYLWAKNYFAAGSFNSGDGGDVPGQLNVLLLGVDTRRGEEINTRTDTMILASVDTRNNRLSLLSIPRDTRVNIPGHGWEKINSANVFGGPKLAMQAVSNLLGIPVKYYVLTNFSGFKEIVDALGGVTIDVERNMYHYDPEDGGAYAINLKKGVQRLDGEKAIQYVRFRSYENGDIDRTQHQQRFLAALAGEMLQPASIPKLPRLVPEIMRYVKTNLGMGDLLALVKAVRGVENTDIATQTLPGHMININGGSYWGVDPTEARMVAARFLKGETFTNVVLTTPLSPAAVGATSVNKVEVKPKVWNQNSADGAPESGEQKPADIKKLPVEPDQETKTGESAKTGSDKSTVSPGKVKITPAPPDPDAGNKAPDPAKSGKDNTTDGSTSRTDNSTDQTADPVDNTNNGGTTVDGVVYLNLS
ncbi:MAG: LytR family transcriptional regulator [Peptococcaceae bacterium]|nr:MAG: LytR family transcriptional regulator [Peptococcaceae bacterium]